MAPLAPVMATRIRMTNEHGFSGLKRASSYSLL
jgi:hypothetical protein